MIYKWVFFPFIMYCFGSSNSTDLIQINYLPTSTTHQIIKHTYYTLSYNEKYEQAEWVAYFLRGDSENSHHFKRPKFSEDPKISSTSARLDNYKKSGYDRGHLCAAADMRFSKEAYDETFFTSNVTPQKHNFNDGVWKNLEEKTRYWSQKYNGIYVITGGVLQKGLPTIGAEHVAIPNYFYKILFCSYKGKYKMIAFLVPHQKSNQPIYSFVVSVDYVEKLTGIDFFPQLDNQIETALEKQSDYKNWSF